MLYFFNKHTNLFLKLAFALATTQVIFSSCVPTKNIPQGSFLLVNQKIEGNKKIDTEALEAFTKQQPNRRILYLPIMPYLYVYKRGKKNYDKKLPKYKAALVKAEQIYFREDSVLVAKINVATEKERLKLRAKQQAATQKFNEKRKKLTTRIEEGNWLMRSVGEKPTIYDEALIEQSAAQMQLFLKQNGFFRASVTPQIKTKKKKLWLTYQINEGKPHTLNSIRYTISDSTISQLIQKDSSSFLLKTGQVYQEKLIEAERERITRFLNNRGYLDFGMSYIFFEIDTLQNEFEADIEVIISNPTGKAAHPQFSVTEIIFETDVNVTRSRKVLKDTVYRGIRYVEEKSRYSKKILDSKVFIRKDSLYSRFNTEETQRALAQLDIFKFVNINYDTLGTKAKASIFTSPYDKYQYALEGGLNVTQALPGPFVSLSFKNRNTLGGCEILELRGRFGLEAQASVTDDSDSYNSQEYGGNISLSFPRILFPLGKKVQRLLRLGIPQTQLSLGFSFVDRPEYSRTNIQSALTYQWQNRNRGRFQLSLLDLGVVYTSRISDAFANRLEELAAQGNTLSLSFTRSLLSSIVTSYVQSSKNYGTAFDKSHYFKAYLELGGNYLNIIDELFYEDSDEVFGLRYYRFAKVSFDYRLALPLGENRELVSRINVGVAKPYGQAQNSLPYEKFFFTGGSNSNRAWRPRRLGPGSYTPPQLDDGTFDYSFEQGGEVITELNTELRGHLFSFFDYALFIDASNIWMTEEDASRPGAKFEFRDFWRELAVGTGFGLRLDFSFLLVRFDMGIKMYDPALPEGSRFVGDNISLRNPLGSRGQSTLNIGVGYPF